MRNWRPTISPSEDAEQPLLEQTVADYSKSLALTQRLYKGGAAAVADVDQAQAQLETARTQAADIALQHAQTEHAIAVLIGGVAAANAQIGVARAAYFPVFSLGAAIGYDSVQPSNWLNAASRLWSVGPSGVLTVFDAGRHRAQSAQAHAQYDEQVADYRNTVLTAYQEVQDNLAALHRLEQESVSEAAAVSATGKALEQAQYRYKAGLVTYLEVATNETTNLEAQLSRADILNRRMAASVLLVKALGGGWHGELLAQSR